jgi:hypothetical protein
LAWIAIGWRTDPVFGVLATVPGGLMLGTGVALFLWPGDRQITHYMALGAVLSVPLALVAMPWAGFLPGLLFLLLAAPAFVTAGRVALLRDPPPSGVPAPEPGAGMAAKVAIDETILAYFLSVARIPDGDQIERDAAELAQWETALEDNDWTESPADFHSPPPPADPELRERRAAGQSFLHLCFESGYRPHTDLPGGERWLSHTRNRHAHAWVFRHPGPPRPWLVGIHGYRMGLPWMDFTLFNIRQLHHRLGLNLLLPVLPLHGPRRSAHLTGGGYLDGPMTDIVHAEAQAAWDLRRVLGWLRDSESAPAVGVLGYSLGGYNAALLAALEPDLDSVIAGIPLTDISGALWRHMPRMHLRYIESRGITRERLQQSLAPVSPLALPPLVSPERRHIFAATGDRIVPLAQPLALWRHWEEPDHLWYHGSHMSVRRERPVAAFIRDTLIADGLVAGGRTPAPDIA